MNEISWNGGRKLNVRDALLLFKGVKICITQKQKQIIQIEEGGLKFLSQYQFCVSCWRKSVDVPKFK